MAQKLTALEHLYRFSLYLLIGLLLAVLLAGLYDIGQQVITRNVQVAGHSTRVSDTIITAGTYVVTVRSNGFLLRDVF